MAKKAVKAVLLPWAEKFSFLGKDEPTDLAPEDDAPIGEVSYARSGKPAKKPALEPEPATDDPPATQPADPEPVAETAPAPEPVAEPAPTEPAPTEPEPVVETTSVEPPAPEPFAEPMAEPAPHVPVNQANSIGLYATYLTGRGDKGVFSDFNIELAFSGSWTVARQAEVIKSAEYLSYLITGDLPSVGAVDDLRLTVKFGAIDGVYGAIGKAAPTALRPDGYLPSAGTVTFDSSDAGRVLKAGLLDDLALHEMSHALGFGSLWSLMKLTAKIDGDARFTGPNATLAYQTEYAVIAGTDAKAGFGASVEMDGGSGTAGVHWDDFTFRNEIMTGYLNNDNHMSTMTVASFEDMGYQTRFDATDPDVPILQMDELFFA